MKDKIYLYWKYLVAIFHVLTFGIFYKAPEGLVLNPLRKIRNYPCACKSGKKIKDCHGKPRYVLEKDAVGLDAFVRRVKDHEKRIMEGV